MKKLILPLFILVALVQWLVPGNMIFEREKILRNGKAWRFLTEPVDPSNPFIGRYITLNFEAATYNTTQSVNLESGQSIYVLLLTDAAGYAKVASLATKEPTDTEAYIKARTSYVYSTDSGTTVRIDYPFDTYYMDEYKAPKAELIYGRANRDTTQKTCALVKIWKGKAVIQHVLINNKPIEALIK